MKDRLAQIKFMAANYTRLQGLRAIPLGLLAVFVSIWALSNQGPTAKLTEPILAAIAAALLYLWIDRYYNHTFGRVKQPSSRHKTEWIESIVGGTVALSAFVLEIKHILPFSALGLVFAVCFLEYFWRVDKSEWGKVVVHFSKNIVAAILIAVISILPLFGIFVWEAFGIQWQIVGIFIFFGIAITVTGIVGHIRMIRALPSLDSKPNDVTAV
jgi:magnesium-transporting ATPase (P-type)